MAKNDTEIRIKALADFLDVSPEYITKSKDYDTFEYDKESYLVLTDDEADEEFYWRAKDLIDDIGLDSFSEYAKSHIIQYCVDNKRYFKDIYHDILEWIIDSPDSYTGFFDIDDIKQDIIKRAKKDELFLKEIFNSDLFLIMQKHDKNLETGSDIDILEEFLDSLDDEEIILLGQDLDVLENLYNDATEKYLSQYHYAYDFLVDLYGKDEKEILKSLENYIDWDSVIDYIEDSDGRGPTLAIYDGEENEIKGDNGEYYYIYRID